MLVKKPLKSRAKQYLRVRKENDGNNKHPSEFWQQAHTTMSAVFEIAIKHGLLQDESKTLTLKVFRGETGCVFGIGAPASYGSYTLSNQTGITRETRATLMSGSPHLVSAHGRTVYIRIQDQPSENRIGKYIGRVAKFLRIT